MRFFPIRFRRLSTFCLFFAETPTLTIFMAILRQTIMAKFSKIAIMAFLCLGWYGQKYGSIWVSEMHFSIFFNDLSDFSPMTPWSGGKGATLKPIKIFGWQSLKGKIYRQLLNSFNSFDYLIDWEAVYKPYNNEGHYSTDKDFNRQSVPEIQSFSFAVSHLPPPADLQIVWSFLGASMFLLKNFCEKREYIGLKTRDIEQKCFWWWVCVLRNKIPAEEILGMSHKLIFQCEATNFCRKGLQGLVVSERN